MSKGVIFDERIALQLGATGAVSQTLGPGRMGRCQQCNLRLHFGSGNNPLGLLGSADIEVSHSQLFPGTPEVIASFAALDNATAAYAVPSKYLGMHLRVKLTADIPGEGLTVYASGTR